MVSGVVRTMYLGRVGKLDRSGEEACKFVDNLCGEGDG